MESLKAYLARDASADLAVEAPAEGEVVTMTRLDYNKQQAEAAIKDQRLVELAGRLAGFQERSKSLELMVALRDQLLAERELELKQLQIQLDPSLALQSSLIDGNSGISTPYRDNVSDVETEASPWPQRRGTDDGDGSHRLQQNGLMLAGLMSSLLKLEAHSELSLDGVEPPAEDSSDVDEETTEDPEETF